MEGLEISTDQDLVDGHLPIAVTFREKANDDEPPQLLCRAEFTVWVPYQPDHHAMRANAVAIARQLAARVAHQDPE